MRNTHDAGGVALAPPALHPGPVRLHLRGPMPAGARPPALPGPVEARQPLDRRRRPDPKPPGCRPPTQPPAFHGVNHTIPQILRRGAGPGLPPAAALSRLALSRVLQRARCFHLFPQGARPPRGISRSGLPRFPRPFPGAAPRSCWRRQMSAPFFPRAGRTSRLARLRPLWALDGPAIFPRPKDRAGCLTMMAMTTPESRSRSGEPV